MKRPDPFRNQAAQHIAFVRGGAGDDQIRLRHPRAFLHLYIAALPVHTDNVHAVHGIPQLFLIIID